MSAIYFHEQGSKDARVSGAERAAMESIIGGLSCAMLGLHDWRPEDPLLVWSETPDIGYLRTKVMINDATFNLPDGRAIDSLHLRLNTAVRLGGDGLRFVARCNAQCEVHGYVEGHNRAWLADVIHEALDNRLLRTGMGWQAVLDMLRGRSDRPVVSSYSVTDGFPDAPMDFEEEARERFYDLTESEQWADATARLRGGHPLLRWCPQNWAQTFDNGLSAMDLRQLADGIKDVP